MAPLLEARAKLVLDLSRLLLVGSSGLGAFISCLRKLKRQTRRPESEWHVEAVRAVFELVRMHRVFVIASFPARSCEGFPILDHAPLRESMHRIDRGGLGASDSAG